MDTKPVAVASRILDVLRTEKTIEFTFSSDVSLVDRVVPQACEYLEERGLADLGQFKIVLRELLLNAIEHGNGCDPSKTVHCQVTRMRGSMIEVGVEDQGSGFAHQNLDMAMPEDPSQLRRRGYALINEICEAIQFNDQGNRATVFLQTASEPTFDVREEEGWQTVHVNADLTASVADKFRILLLGLVNAGHTRFRFDLKEVEDIDSVTLSVLFVLAKMLADRGRGADLEIVNANKSLQTLFRMTRLDRTYSIVAQ